MGTVRSRRGVAYGLTFVVGACGPGTIDPAAGSSGTSTSPSTESTAAETVGETTSAGTIAPTSSDASTGATSNALTSTGADYPECESGALQLFTASAGLDLGEWPPSAKVEDGAVWEIDTDCTVEEAYVSDVQNVGMSCAGPSGDSPLTLHADFTGQQLPFEIGQVVRLRYYASRVRFGAWGEWTVLRDSAGALAFGSVNASLMDLEVGFPGDPDAFAPFAFQLASGLCMPTEGYPCGTPSDPCERLAVDVSAAVTDARIFDGQQEEVVVASVPHLIRVGEAKHLTGSGSAIVSMIVVPE